MDEEPDFDAVLFCFEDVSSDVIGGDMREIGEDGCHGFPDVGRTQQIAGVGGGFNPHNWRYGAARGMIKNGASLIEVCQLLGHSSVTVTGDYYGTFDEEELRESHREYSWIE